MTGLFKLFLIDPEGAAKRCRQDDALLDALKIYALWAVLSLAFARFSPLDYLDPNAPVLPAKSAGFWLRVLLWEPVLFSLGIASTSLAVYWLKDGWLALKAAVATAWTAAPLILTIAYTRDSLSKPAFAAAMLAWLALGVWAGRRIPRQDWRPLASFLLAMNAIGIVSLLPQAIVISARSLKAYYAVALVVTLWTLAVAGRGLRELCAIPLPRAVLAFLFGFAALLCFMVAAYFLGWLPMEVLKVLIYV